MDKRKGIILAVIIFLLIGLGTFVFANPSNESLKGNDTDTNKNEDTQNDLDDENTNDGEKEEGEEDNTPNTNHGNGGNQSGSGSSGSNTDHNNQGGSSVPNVDNAYNDALAAVEKAEKTLNQEDVDYAETLVNALADSNDKTGLVNRVDVVQNVIDVTLLVQELQDKTNNATNKDTLEVARDFRVDEDIIAKVSSLSNEERKNELNNILDELASILDDTKSPEISGIGDEDFTNKNVSITITDTNDVTVLLNEETVNLDDLKDLSREGEYILVVTDEAFNSTSITFTIDKTAPVIQVDDQTYTSSDEIIYSKGRFVALAIDELSGIDKIYTNGHERVVIDVTSDGRYEFKVIDKAGNESYFVVMIDSIAPELEIEQLQENGFVNTENTQINVSDVNTFTTEILDQDGKVLNTRTSKVNDNKTNYDRFGIGWLGEGTFTVRVTDVAGNVIEKTFTVDVTAPKITKVPENGSAVNYSVSPKIEDENLDTVVLTKNGTVVEGYQEAGMYELSHDGVYTITATDKAGNQTEVIFTIDKTAPVFDNLRNGIYYQDDITVQVEDENLAKIVAKIYATNEETEIENGTVLDLESIYYLTAIDKAGNSTSIYIAVDKTNPIFKDLINGHQYQDVTVQVEDLKVKTIWVYSYNDKTTKEVSNGYELKEDGTYKLTATDYAGRTTSIYVELDTVKPDVILKKWMKDDNHLEVEPSQHNYCVLAFVNDKNLKSVSLNKEEYENGTLICEDGNYALTAVDKAGNETVINFVVDRTYPIVSINGEDYQGTKDAGRLDEVNIEIVEDYVSSIILWYNDEKVEYNDFDFTQEGTYKLEVRDEAKNKTVVTFFVGKYSTSIELIEPDSLVYDGQAKEFVAQLFDQNHQKIDIPLNIVYEDENGNRGSAVDAGKYTAIVYFAGNEDYEPAYFRKEFTISKADTLFTFVAPASLVYDGQVKEYEVILKDQYGNVLNETISIAYKNDSLEKIDAINAGQYSISAHYAGNKNYNATYSIESFEITKATPSIEVEEPNLYYDNQAKEYSVRVIGADGKEISDPSMSIVYQNMDTKEFLDSAPIEVGNYRIGIYVRENSNYTRADKWINFSIIEKPVASVIIDGVETTFTSFTEMFEAIPDNTLTDVIIFDDIKEDIVIPTNKVVNLDLNNKTLSGNKVVTNYGTIKEIKNGSIVSENNAVINHGVIETINDLAINSKRTGINNSNGTIYTIKNSNIEAIYYPIISDNQSIIKVLENNTVVGHYQSAIDVGGQSVINKIVSGSYTTDGYYGEGQSVAGFGIYIGSKATVNEIAGGSFKGSKAAVANYGTIKLISGGNFEKKYEGNAWDLSKTFLYSGKVENITGGRFYSYDNTVSGIFTGKYNLDPNYTFGEAVDQYFTVSPIA